MADDLVVTARLRDELTAPIRRVRREVAETARAVRTLNRSGAEKTLSNPARAAEKFGQQVHSLDRRLRTLSGTLTSYVARGFRTLAIGLGAATVAGTVFSLKTAANLQVTRVGFEALTGSAQGAADVFAFIKELDPKAPFDLQQLSQAALFLGNSGMEGEKLRKTMQGVVDVAALAPDRFDDTARAIAQVAGSGSLLAQDLNQLVQAGAPVEKALQKAFGVSLTEFRNRGTNESFSSDQFLTALFGVTQGRAEQVATQTLTGLWSSVRSRAMLKLSDAGSPLVQSLMAAMPTLEAGVGSLLDHIAPPLVELGASLLDLFVRALPAATPVLTALANGVNTLLSAAAPALAGLSGIGDELAGGIGEFFTALAPIMPDLVRFLGALVAIFPDWLRLMTALLPLLIPFLRVMTALLDLAPVRGILMGIFTAMMAYRAVSGLVGGITAFANALILLNTARNGAAGVPLPPGVAGPVLPGASVGQAGKNLLGGGLVLGGALGAAQGLAQPRKSFKGGEVLSMGASGAMAGAGVGLLGGPFAGVSVPVGAVVGGALGLAGGAAKYLLSGNERKNAGTTVDARVILPPGAIIVQNPADDVDLQRAISSGIADYNRDRTERGSGGSWGR